LEGGNKKKIVLKGEEMIKETHREGNDWTGGSTLKDRGGLLWVIDQACKGRRRGGKKSGKKRSNERAKTQIKQEHALGLQQHFKKQRNKPGASKRRISGVQSHYLGDTGGRMKGETLWREKRKKRGLPGCGRRRIKKN